MLIQRIKPYIIFDYVKNLYNIAESDIKGCSREPYILEARWICIYCLKIFGYGYAEIGRILSMHHTSAMYAYKKLSNAIDLDTTHRLSYIIHELNRLSGNDPLDLAMYKKEF